MQAARNSLEEQHEQLGIRVRAVEGSLAAVVEQIMLQNTSMSVEEGGSLGTVSAASGGSSGGDGGAGGAAAVNWEQQPGAPGVSHSAAPSDAGEAQGDEQGGVMEGDVMGGGAEHDGYGPGADFGGHDDGDEDDADEDGEGGVVHSALRAWRNLVARLIIDSRFRGCAGGKFTAPGGGGLRRNRRTADNLGVGCGRSGAMGGWDRGNSAPEDSGVGSGDDEDMDGWRPGSYGIPGAWAGGRLPAKGPGQRKGRAGGQGLGSAVGAGRLGLGGEGRGMRSGLEELGRGFDSEGGGSRFRRRGWGRAGRVWEGGKDDDGNDDDGEENGKGPGCGGRQLAGRSGVRLGELVQLASDLATAGLVDSSKQSSLVAPLDHQAPSVLQEQQQHQTVRRIRRVQR